MMKRFWMVGMAAASLALAAGCGEASQPGAEGAEGQAPAAPAQGVESDVVALPPPPKDDDVVAAVGEATLTWGALQTRVAEEIAAFEKSSGQAVPEEMRPQFEQNVRMRQVANFIESTLIANAAQAAGVKVDDAARAAFAERLQKEAGQTVEQLVASSPYGKERTERLLEQSILATALFEDVVLKDVKVTDEEVAAELEKNAAEGALAQQALEACAKRIAEGAATFEDLVKSDSLVKREMELPEEQLTLNFPEAAVKAIQGTPEGGVTQIVDVPGAKVMFKVLKRAAAAPDAESGAKKAKLEEIRGRILKGEDFAKLAETFSECPSGKRAGGDLDEFGRGMMVKPFEDVAFSLPVGEVSEVFKTPFGWHIVKVTARDDAAGKVRASHILLLSEDKPATVTLLPLVKAVPAQATAEEIRAALTNERRGKALQEWFEAERVKQGVSSSLYPELGARPATPAQP